MEENQIILILHEELLKTNRDLKYFKDDCSHKFKNQKRLNRFLICCLISIFAEKIIKKIKNVNEKGTSNAE